MVFRKVQSYDRSYFDIYINDPIKAISFSNMHSFADEANIFYESKSLKNINKKINYDMHRVTNWLRTNRISLNVAKTKITIFR